MTIEVIVTILLVLSAGYIFYKNIRKKSSGECGCCGGDKPKRKFHI